MTLELGLVLLLLTAAVAMFVRNRPRMDVVALIVIVLLPFTGTVTATEAIAGFADPNIVLIAVLFVLGEGLARTGVARALGDLINRQAKGSEFRLLVLLMISVAALGAAMSSTAVVAIFIPVVLRICRNTGTAPSQLMMPLSFAALISGMMTLVATAPNLVVNAELARQGVEGFGFFGVTPFGLVVLATGIVYMLAARRWLAKPGKDQPEARRRPTFADWIERYGLADREFRGRVMAGSKIAGRRLDEIAVRNDGINLLAIERPRPNGLTELLRPSAASVLQPGDVLLLDIRVPADTIEPRAREYGIERLSLVPRHRYLTDRSQDLGMTEAIVPYGSSLVGRTVLEARVRREHGLTVIGLRRGTNVIGEGFLDEELRVGDTLLLTGFWQDVRRLQREQDDLVVLHLPQEMDEVLPAAGKAPQALAILGLVILLMVTGVIPNVHAVLIGCLLMGLFGCVDMPSAYRSINWQTLVLIVGMMPFSLALQRTGGVDLASDGLLAVAGEGAPRLVLALIFLATAVLGMFISNTATAILMAPVALAVAADLGASPYPFAMIVVLASSTAFMTPISSPVNTLVVGPGNYGFADFIRIGVPFSILTWLISVLLVPVLLPF